ncbi:MAG: hypothetical protein WD030_03250 [Pirellulales bacterium]
MQSPIQFPDPQQERVRRCAEFQRLSPDERWREIVGLMALGLTMTRTSERREWIEQRQADEQAHWRQIQQELFARHGK